MFGYSSYTSGMSNVCVCVCVCVCVNVVTCGVKCVCTSSYLFDVKCVRVCESNYLIVMSSVCVNAATHDCDVRRVRKSHMQLSFVTLIHTPV